MKLQTQFERKRPHFDLDDAVVTDIELLPHHTFDLFSRNLMSDQDFIAMHTDQMGVDKDGIWHCLLVLDRESENGFLIESEGYNYARYASFIPQIKAFVRQEFQQVAAEMAQQGTEQTTDGNWSFQNDELQEYLQLPLKKGNAVSELLSDELAQQSKVSGLTMDNDGVQLDFYADCCPNLQSMNESAVAGFEMNL